MTEPHPSFQRNVNAVVDAFKAGLAFDPPAISVAEFRASLRNVGLPLTEPDELELPQFEFPVIYPDPSEDESLSTPEGDDDGNDPTA